MSWRCEWELAGHQLQTTSRKGGLTEEEKALAGRSLINTRPSAGHAAGRTVLESHAQRLLEPGQVQT